MSARESGGLLRADVAGAASVLSVGIVIAKPPMSSGLPNQGRLLSIRRTSARIMGIAYCAGIGIRLLFKLAMIQTEPAMTRKTTSTPKARARILFVLSG